MTLLQSAEDVMPLTWGWWQPVILLPAEADEWSPERRRVVLLHELAHVKRWDCLTQLIARLACAVYWFNPLVWVAARRMCVERERACDDLVLNGGCKASDYAAHLVEIAQTFRRVPQVAAIAMARSSHLEGRIAAIVDASRTRRAPRTLLVGLFCVVVLAFVAVVAAQKPEANSPTPSSEAKPWFDARLRSFFAAKADQARKLAAQDRHPEAKLRMIVLNKSNPDARKLAEQILAKLKSGASFEEMATVFSERSPRNAGAEWFQPSKLRKELAEAVANLKTGESSELIETPEACYLIRLEETRPAVAPEVWPYFEAGIRGDWQTATNLWVAMRRRAHQYEGTTPDDTLDTVWSPILETDLAWEQFGNWQENYVLAYGNDIINSIPPGSIYFGGTDPGRGVITAMSESHAEGKPFFTLTQNALADGTYLDYLRAMYGPNIYTPTAEDSQKSFNEYLADAQRRLAENKLKPGEDVRTNDGKVQVSGQVAVMNINGLITKIIFDRNPDRDFYVEESFPLDWMYPHLSPNGLIMKINRQPLAGLSEEIVQQDHEYWSRYLRTMLGDWLDYDTSVAEVTAFVEKVYLKHDLGGFTGDPLFVEDTWTQKVFSKLRSSIGGLYAWRSIDPQATGQKQQMTAVCKLQRSTAYASTPRPMQLFDRFLSQSPLTRLSITHLPGLHLEKILEKPCRISTPGEP